MSKTLGRVSSMPRMRLNSEQSEASDSFAQNQNELTHSRKSIRKISSIHQLSDSHVDSEQEVAQMSPLGFNPRKNSYHDGPYLLFKDPSSIHNPLTFEKMISSGFRERDDLSRVRQTTTTDESVLLPNINRYSSVDEHSANRMNTSVLNTSNLMLATSKSRLEEVRRAKIPNFDLQRFRTLNDTTYRKMVSLNKRDPTLNISKEAFMSEHERAMYQKMRNEIKEMVETKPIREIKMQKWECFHIIKDDKVFLKLGIRRKAMPITIRMDFYTEKVGVFVAYVSRKVSRPSAERHDMRVTTPNFDIYYGEHTKIESLYITIEAVTTLDFNLLAFFSENKGNQEVEEDYKAEVDWRDLYLKNMKKIQLKSQRKHYLTGLNEDELMYVEEEIAMIKQKRKEQMLSLAKGQKNLVEQNIKAARDYKEIVNTHRKSHSMERERKLEKAQSLKVLHTQEKMVHTIVQIQKRAILKGMMEEETRKKNEAIQRSKFQRKWTHIIAFNFLMASIEKRFWAVRLKKMIQRGRERAAARIQKAWRKYIQRKAIGTKERFGSHFYNMLYAFAKINKKRAAPVAQKFIARVIKVEVRRNFCLKKIPLMRKSAIIIQRYMRRWMPVLRARVLALDLLLKDMLQETLEQVEELKTAVANKKKRKPKQPDDVEDQLKLATQLLGVLKKIDTNPVLVAKLLRVYLKNLALDYYDEVKEQLDSLKEKKREKQRERQVEIERTKMRLNQLEEAKKGEEDRLPVRRKTRIARSTLKFEPVLEKRESSAKKLSVLKKQVMTKISTIKVLAKKPPDFGAPQKKILFLIFKKNALVEFFEEQFKPLKV